jgi:DNA-binding beta-propeller fold protein YncE
MARSGVYYRGCMHRTIALLSLFACIPFAANASLPMHAVHGPVSSQQTDKSISQAERAINLPSSKQLELPLPGSPGKTNSLPMSLEISPDGRYAATLNAGFGTAPSHYEQSVLVVDLRTGQQVDFPDARTLLRSAHQTFYQGLAWSGDGKHLYASLASLTAPEGGKPGETGNAIAVYDFSEGAEATPHLTPVRLIPIPLQKLAVGKTQNVLDTPIAAGMAIPYPAGLCLVKRRGRPDALLVADDMSDDALLIDAGTGRMLTRFDLSDAQTVPAAYPITVTATKDGKRGFVALWNGSSVAELDLVHGLVLGKLRLLGPQVATDPGSHPASLMLAPDQKTLYMALANRDMAAAVAVPEHTPMQVLRFYDTKLPGQTYFGAVPDAIAISPDGQRLFVANASSDAVAVYNAGHGKSRTSIRPIGFVPTGWYPTALGATASELLIATAKSEGTGPNNLPQADTPATAPRRSRTYIATMLYGSFARVPLDTLTAKLPAYSEEVIRDNRLKAAAEQIAFAAGGNPIKHVIYIIKENRAYDQILGDEPAANGDPSLTMYGRSITPNEHRLAEQFGILDDFYDSGEVSGDGHVWSNAAITSDYTEKTWQQSYRGGERMYDYEGVVSGVPPLLQGIPDVNEPESGYLWTNLAKHGKTFYHFGEYISTTFCTDKPKVGRPASPLLGTPEGEATGCARTAIRKGEPVPANYGGGVSPYPWAIPMIASNVATKPQLRGHFDPRYPDFELAFPDQMRVDEFLTKFRGWDTAMKAGNDTMPDFVQLRLPNDHTAGTRPGMPTPEASVADNDLAVGRAVEAISHSPYWNNTAFFILEDDAQDGADHVDAHRSIMFVVSKYAPRPEDGKPFVDHRFYTTVSAIHTMENLMGLPPMNDNDAFASLMAPEFTGAGDQPAYTAGDSNETNSLIYTANTVHSPGAKASARMDFRHADMAPTAELNDILWRDAMGNKPLPPQLVHPPADALRPDRDDDDKDGK